MTILIDMDDTIENLLEVWVAGVNKKYNRSVSCEDVYSWDVSMAYPGLTFEQVYAIPFEKGFWENVRPIPGAADAIRNFMIAGHDVYIVTATPYEAVAEKMTDFLFKYFPFLTWKQLIITNNKQLIRGDILIDDGVHNLEGGDYIKILMTAPHNRDYDAEKNGMIRVYNWIEIEEVINKISKDREE